MMSWFRKVPREMKKFDQWVLWRKNAKGVKILFQLNGEPAKVNDPNTWNSFLNIVSFYKQNQDEYNGIGYVFSKNDPYTIIDLDNKKDDPKLSKHHHQLIKKFQSYTEVSQSGKGYHIILKNNPLPGDRKRKEPYEVYEDVRFIAITGQIYHQKYSKINTSSYFNEFYQKYLDDDKNNYYSITDNDDTLSKSDIDILDLITSGPYKSKFKKMLEGKLKIGEKYKEPDYPSLSEMDFAFASIIVHYTQNTEQIERLYKKTKLEQIRKNLKDDKWNKRKDYRERTIKNAIKAVGKKSIDRGIIQGENGIQIIYPKFARYLLKKIPCFTPKGQEEKITIYYYNDGIYKDGGRSKLRKLIMKELGDFWRPSYPQDTLIAIEDILTAKDIKINPDDGCVVVENGILNLFTKELSEFTSDRISTVKFPVIYNPKAKCPKTMKFLKEVLHHCTIPAIFEFLGDTIRHGKPKYPKELNLKGPSRTGKSTITDILEAVIGKENRSALTPQDIIENKGYDRVELYTKYANIRRDISNLEIKNPEIWKEIVEGEPITARRIRKDPITFEPYARHIFSTNGLPKINDSSSRAIIDRKLIISVDKVQYFSDNPNKIENLADQLIESELSGIFNKAIEGLHRLDEQKGFTISKIMKEEARKYLEKIDNVAEFISTQCILDKKEKISSSHLYEQYKSWCSREEIRYIRVSDFKEKLWNEYRLEYKQAKSSYGNTKHYIGIGLNIDFE